MAAVWLFVAGWPVPHRYFGEGRVGTWLTAGGLFGTAVTLWCATAALAGMGRGSTGERRLGWWLSAWFAAAAADDAFSFHERFGAWLRAGLGTRRSLAGEEIGTVLLLAAGVALAVSLALARGLRRRYRGTLRWWALAVLLAGIMLVLDGVTEDRRILLRMGLGREAAVWWKYRLEGLEEVCKMTGVYLFWAGAVAAFGRVVGAFDRPER